jgi:hypothetical protein
MNNTFRDMVGQCLEVYVDDILLYSKDFEEHLDHLQKTLEKLREKGLTAKPKKCFFALAEVPYMGYIIGENSIKPDPKKVDVIKNYPYPKTINEMQRLMGMLKYLRIFIPRFADLVAPLQQVMKGQQKRKGKNNTRFEWTEEMNTAFNQVIQILITPPTLTFPDPAKKKKIVSDGSKIACGFVLLQLEEDGQWHPILYHSIKKKLYQQTYGPFDSETLTIVEALDYCRPYIYGQEILVETDHDALKYLMDSKKQLSHRHARWLDRLLEYNPVINHIPGKKNGLSDALSRLTRIYVLNEMGVQPIDNTVLSLLHSNIVVETKDFEEQYQEGAEADKFMQRIKEKLKDGHLDHFYEKDKKLYYIDHLGTPRLVIPEGSIKEMLLYEAHDSKTCGHNGRDRMLEKLSEKYFWPRMARTVRQYIAGCFKCQTCKAKAPNSYSARGMTTNGQRWDNLSMDFITKLPMTAKGHDCIWTVVDRTTKRAHFIAGRTSDTAEDVANSFIKNIFKLHGVPRSIISDRDPKFVSEFWREVWEKLDTKIKMSTSNRPQTDGQSEIVNKAIGTMIRIYTSYDMTEWDEMLPILEFAYNSAPNRTIGMTPFEADLGFLPRNVFDTVAIDATNELSSHEDFLVRQQQNLTLCHDAIRMTATLMQLNNDKKPRQYDVGEQVLVLRDCTKDPNEKLRPKNKWKPTYVGPFRIKEKISDHAYEIDWTPDIKTHPVVNVSSLKPYIKNNDNEFPQRTVQIPVPIDTDMGEEWPVDKIIAHKFERRCPYFLTRYKGYPEIRDHWTRWDCFFEDDANAVTEAFLRYVVEHPEATHWTLRHWLRYHGHVDLPEPAGQRIRRRR